MPHHSEDTMMEILRRMPRYKLSDKQVSEQIDLISKKVSRKTFSIIRGLQLVAFIIAAMAIIVLVPLIFSSQNPSVQNNTNPSLDEKGQSVPDKEKSKEETLTKDEALLQAIKTQFEDANSPPKQGIKNVEQQGGTSQTEYNNGIIIGEDGTMIAREKDAKPEPYQYKAFIKGLISDIGPRANGYSSAEVHIKSIREGNGFIGVGGPNTYDHQMKRMNQCLKYAPEISPELNQYLSDTKEVLEEAVHNKDKEKLAEAFKRIYDLHAVLFPEN